MFEMQGQVEQWIDFTTQEIDAPMLSWFLPIIGFMEFNQKVTGCISLMWNPMPCLIQVV